MHKNLRSFIDLLRKENDLAEISVEVNPYLEIAEIHRRIIDEQGKALLFTNVEWLGLPSRNQPFWYKETHRPGIWE